MSALRNPEEPSAMILGVSLQAVGHHLAGWRYPSSVADGGVNLRHYISMAQLAERGVLDFLFMADSYALRERSEAELRHSAKAAVFEPITLISALTAVTERIGLVATASTTYNEPFHVARKFASIDHLSGGRAGWNVVTSNNEDEALNFGGDAHPVHADRYDRALEFVEVVSGLWRSWEADAFIRDKDSGLYIDTSKLKTLDHKGLHFSVKGPLNIPRSPQGRPAIFQAGSSESGRQLAASTADAIFTAQSNLEDAVAFRQDIRRRAISAGRKPDDIKVLPGLQAVVAESASEARDIFSSLQKAIEPEVALSLLAASLGIRSLPIEDIDKPLPAITTTNGPKSRQALLIDMARKENLTTRELAMRIAGARGHSTLVGTPVEIADRMEEWFRLGGADGFVLMPPYLPEALETFIELVVPRLRSRGVLKENYTGTTLREHLGVV
jgi:FMN-dependent oxidoreductase (nitrilotriacetate monooxygenase family)